MFVTEKDDGAQLLLNLSKFPFSCRFISSDTDRAELNDVASKQWSKGEFDVLISTNITLVGNENPLCRHVAVAGYLFDTMQIVQAFGRLRNYMRCSTGRMHFSVPSALPTYRIKEDDHRFTRLINEKFVSQDNRESFRATMTSSGVCNWTLNLAQPSPGSCSMKKLSASFGKQRQDCSACPSCLTILTLTSTIQNEANLEGTEKQTGHGTGTASPGEDMSRLQKG